MKRLFLLSIILPVFGACQQSPQGFTTNKMLSEKIIPQSNGQHYSNIGQIPVPEGYKRIDAAEGSFAKFIRTLALKTQSTVFLYNGQPKGNQKAQFAVINLSIGKKDLQQCADAVMRIRAEYLYATKRFDEIRFIDNANVVYSFNAKGTRIDFDRYLEKVFNYCGTHSLEKQLHKRSKMEEVQIGDVLIKGGSPGHAMLVVDMATDSIGRKIILLSQGYMPAQDIHIVKNPGSATLSPWYLIDNEKDIITPEWDFKPFHLKHW